MYDLVFATNNAHKLHEARLILGNSVRVRSLEEIGCFDEIPETGTTFRENALQKARYIYDKYGCDCFADDSGLEVDALGGAPGIYSARYANKRNYQGKETGNEANIMQLLEDMAGYTECTERAAQFHTTIALITNGQEMFFDGIIRGNLRTELSGSGGFGYDPIFQPEGYAETFGTIPEKIKNTISHRAIALRKMRDILLCHSPHKPL